MEESDDENPEFCEEKCKNCTARCLYSLAEISKLSKQQAIEELHNHSHPKCRIIKKPHNHQRNLEETRKELIEHFILAH